MIKKFKAITLVETLVYISIFGIFILILIQFFLSVQINQDRIYKELELEANQVFVTNHFRETVDGNFVLRQEGDSAIFFNNQESLEYKLVEGDLFLVKDGNNEKLTNSKAIVDSFSLENIGSGFAVRVSISLVHRDNARVSRNFSSLIKLVGEEDED